MCDCKGAEEGGEERGGNGAGEERCQDGDGENILLQLLLLFRLLSAEDDVLDSVVDAATDLVR